MMASMIRLSPKKEALPPPARRRSLRLVPIGVALAGALLLAGAVAFALVYGALTWMGFPAPARRPTSVAEALDIVKIALAIVAGIGGVVALVVAYRRQRVAEASEAREQTKLFAERLDKAADRLGSDSATVRLAGAYAVAAIGDEWVEGRRLCGSILFVFLRSRHEQDPFVKETVARIFTEHVGAWGMIIPHDPEAFTGEARPEEHNIP
ncbi:hypothetical protein [Streptosporangium sp. NPDC048865]|uniref:hypothetical protein n=1 Tax=Streptosporangium sp. NPDC048865 TaxID=3155766 RepID=UPI00344130C5